jgi:hypothetical protein
MNPTESPQALETDSALEASKPHPWAARICRTWSVLCATLFALSVIVQVRRLVLSTAPAPASEVIAWLCFDALFLLGAYAGYELLCDPECCDSAERHPDQQPEHA